MKKTSQNDALLALISTLSVMFVVLFVSIAYFLTFRTELSRREAYVQTQLNAMAEVDQQNSSYGRVAGYETHSE